MQSYTSLPENLRRQFRDIRTFEAAQFVSRLVGHGKRVLVVGDEWGRDFYSLTRMGCTVVNIDIAWNPHLPSLAVADVTRGIPFADSVFDAVVLAEVLEHLFGDAFALRESRRVLKDDGNLVITVPFFNDQPEYHVRIHSDRTVRRLLRHAGFEVTDAIYRGGCISFPSVVGVLARLLGRERVLQFFSAVDLRSGSRDRWWLRRSRYYGACFRARKGKIIDYTALNAAEFSLAATLGRLSPPGQAAHH